LERQKSKTINSWKIDEPIPLLEHLGELRKRIINSLLVIVFCACLVYPFIPDVIKNLTKPVGKLYFLTPTEAFFTKIKLTIFLGLFLSLPFVFYQIWTFVERGLLSREKRFVLPITLLSFLLFTVGACFGYFVIVPTGVQFLLSYGTETLVPMISVSRYISFLFALVFSFGLIFELPLVMGFLTKIGILNYKSLKKNRRIAIVAIFIAAAALTPGPDAFSQLLMAGPLLLLFEAGVLVAYFIEKKNRIAGQSLKKV
jgi:sec-independent protein translocase protein TatC